MRRTLLLDALRAVFGERPFSILEVCATAFAGNPMLLRALSANGLRTLSAAAIGKKLAAAVRDDDLRLDSARGERRYRFPPNKTAQNRAGTAQSSAEVST
jgi:hypothetical protein